MLRMLWSKNMSFTVTTNTLAKGPTCSSGCLHQPLTTQPTTIRWAPPVSSHPHQDLITPSSAGLLFLAREPRPSLSCSFSQHQALCSAQPPALFLQVQPPLAPAPLYKQSPHLSPVLPSSELTCHFLLIPASLLHEGSPPPTKCARAVRTGSGTPSTLAVVNLPGFGNLHPTRDCQLRVIPP